MIRIAILSFAHYHANFWAEAFLAEPDVALTAIWDDDETRGKEAAGRFGVPFIADLDRAIATSDAVAICSETVAHAPLVERAARAGRSVLCEKPIAVNLIEAARISTAVRESGIAFMQSFPKRFDPASHELRRLVSSGELGRIGLVRIRHGHFYGFDADFADRWYVDPAKSGGGALLDEGIHAADFLCWAFGMPKSVLASASSSLGLAVEDQAIALFEYADGMTAEIVASFAFAAADTSIEIYGSDGTALLSGVDLASRDISKGPFLRTFRRDQADREWVASPLVPQFKRGKFHHQNAIAFAAALRSGEAPPVSVDDGVRALVLIARAYESVRNGSRIEL